MRATNLSRSVWNAVADLARRSQTPREVYFSEVSRADPARNLVWVKDFGDTSIPLVAFDSSFAYYDTIQTGEVVRRDDPTNENYQTKTVCPKKGDLVVILDPWGAKRFPICVGLLHASGAWEEN